MFCDGLVTNLLWHVSTDQTLFLQCISCYRPAIIRLTPCGQHSFGDSRWSVINRHDPALPSSHHPLALLA